MNISTSDTSKCIGWFPGLASEPTSNPASTPYHWSHKTNPTISESQGTKGNLDGKQAKKLDQKQKIEEVINAKEDIENMAEIMSENTVKGMIKVKNYTKKCIINTIKWTGTVLWSIIKFSVKCALFIIGQPIKYLVILVDKITDICFTITFLSLMICSAILLTSASLLKALFESIVWVVDSVC